MGSVTQAFEQESLLLPLKARPGGANGTAALHLACLALAFGPGMKFTCPR
jgi:dTDP-4-amino-4,6-dideoxygalactose transaminase